MDELLSLKGLITITISSLLTIKALRINLRVSRDINVKGNGNTVIVNEALSSTQKSFKLLWQVLIISIALTYPFWGEQYNSVLAILVLISTPLAFASFIVTIRGYGLARLPDVFYVVGTAVICWLAFDSRLYLVNTASHAQQIYPTIGYLWEHGFPSASPWVILTQLLIPFAAQCVSVIGFSAIFLSLLYFLFAHLTARHFDDSIRFFLHYIGMGAIGFFVACDGFLAIAYRDFAYIGGLFRAIIPI